MLFRSIEFGIDDGTLWIAPRGLPRKTQSVPEVSAATGLKEYPVFDKKGLRLTTLFNKDIKFKSKINVTSKVAQACGVWVVHELRHHLESETSNGQWFSKLSCARVGDPTPVGGGD